MKSLAWSCVLCDVEQCCWKAYSPHSIQRFTCTYSTDYDILQEEVLCHDVTIIVRDPKDVNDVNHRG